ncbi:hypothetical protein CDAR_387041 [Caerostris darwini]|uniref:Uncharacterized protein n=1 Tax=Caerostris darwini TaxID=1538125 RepID=A0AAV4PRJ9_9ARAC|nr:hypothetical protein CDAR_387041 [Caerostris darwini]
MTVEHHGVKVRLLNTGLKKETSTTEQPRTTSTMTTSGDLKKETSTTEWPRTTRIMTTSRDCYCGKNSYSCQFKWFGQKVCHCFFGYVQIDGYCIGNV